MLHAETLTAKWLKDGVGTKGQACELPDLVPLSNSLYTKLFKPYFIAIG